MLTAFVGESGGLVFVVVVVAPQAVDNRESAPAKSLTEFMWNSGWTGAQKISRRGFDLGAHGQPQNRSTEP
jgi:hypothetical protein